MHVWGGWGRALLRRQGGMCESSPKVPGHSGSQAAIWATARAPASPCTAHPPCRPPGCSPPRQRCPPAEQSGEGGGGGGTQEARIRNGTQGLGAVLCRQPRVRTALRMCMSRTRISPHRIWVGGVDQTRHDAPLPQGRNMLSDASGKRPRTRRGRPLVSAVLGAPSAPGRWSCRSS